MRQLICQSLYSEPSLKQFTRQGNRVHSTAQHGVHARNAVGERDVLRSLCVAAGPHCEGTLLLDRIEQNMRKEYTLEGVYQVRMRMLERTCWNLQVEQGMSRHRCRGQSDVGPAACKSAECECKT